MSILERALGVIYEPQGFSNQSTFLRGTYTGKTVTVRSALGLVPVYSAVSQIAGAVGSLPLKVYQQDGEYRIPAEKHRAWRMLHDEPNPEMGADEVWELVDSHIELWGNAFVYKKRDSLGIVRELWPIDPRRVSVERSQERTRVFWVDGEPFGEDTILHIRNLSPDGLVGYSPIQVARNALAISLAEEEFQGQFLRNEGRPGILLRHPNKMAPEAKERLKAGWNAVKSGDTAVLEEDIKVEPLTMPLEDAQFIEQVEHSDKRIAQMFQLPTSRLGIQSGDSLTYKTVESENQQFVTYTLQRRISRIEGAINRDPSIFSGTSRRFYCEFDLDALLRANIKERFEAYKFGHEAGFLDSDDIRPKENLPERDMSALVLPSPPPPDPEGESNADA